MRRLRRPYAMRGQGRYGCSNHVMTGSCANGRSIRIEIEERMMAGLKDRLMAPEAASGRCAPGIRARATLKRQRCRLQGQVRRHSPRARQRCWAGRARRQAARTAGDGGGVRHAQRIPEGKTIMEQALLRHDRPKGESGRSSAVEAKVQPFEVAGENRSKNGSCPIRRACSRRSGADGVAFLS